MDPTKFPSYVDVIMNEPAVLDVHISHNPLSYRNELCIQYKAVYKLRYFPRVWFELETRQK